MSPSALVNPSWLLAMRWLGGLLAGVGGLWSGLPAPALVAALGVLLSNLALSWRRGSAPGERALAATLALDVILLTVAFSVTGGSGNPITLLYLLPVLIGSFTLRPGWSWGLLALATAGYAGLFVLAPADLHAHDPEAMRLHLNGMFVGFVATGAALVFAFGRLQTARAEAERRLEAARAVEDQNRRLVGLATLAAGAAHELATPLSTVLLVLGELRREASGATAEDLDLARDEVLRCQEILADLSADLGQGAAEARSRVSLAELAAGALRGLPGAEDVVVEAAGGEALLPARLVQQVLRRLLDNALQAAGRAALTLRVEGGALVAEVVDEGPGMAPEVLERAGEPFFTTRPEGRGLGLYFARSVARQLGGALHLDSAPGRGTRVTLRLPAGPP